jgi:hypothetical protein
MSFFLFRVDGGIQPQMPVVDRKVLPRILFEEIILNRISALGEFESTVVALRKTALLHYGSNYINGFKYTGL